MVSHTAWLKEKISSERNRRGNEKGHSRFNNATTNSTVHGNGRESMNVIEGTASQRA